MQALTSSDGVPAELRDITELLETIEEDLADKEAKLKALIKKRCILLIPGCINYLLH